MNEFENQNHSSLNLLLFILYWWGENNFDEKIDEFCWELENWLIYDFSTFSDQISAIICFMSYEFSIAAYCTHPRNKKFLVRTAQPQLFWSSIVWIIIFIVHFSVFSLISKCNLIEIRTILWFRNIFVNNYLTMLWSAHRNVYRTYILQKKK